jgi:hypothetical protein
VALVPVGRSWLLVGAVVLALGTSTTVVAAMPGSAGWSSPVTLAAAAPTVRHGSPLVVLNDRGDAIVAWGASPAGSALVERSLAGEWEPAHPLSAPPDVVALNDRGDALVAWVGGVPDARRVAVAFRRSGGAWQRRTLIPRVGEGSLAIAGALDGKGGAIVIWSSWRRETGDYLVEQAARAPSGAWGRPTVVATANGPAVLALAPNGEAVIAWSQACKSAAPRANCPGSGSVVRAVTRPAGRRWSRPRTLTDPAEESRGPTATVNASGTVLVVWQSFLVPSGQRPVRAVKAVVGTTRGRFSVPQRLFDDNASDVLRVGLAPSGEGFAVWSGSTGVNDDRVYVARRRPHGGFASTVTLGDGFEPSLAIDRRGAAIVAWTRPSGPSFPGDSELFVHAARRPRGGAFGAGVDLAPVGRDCTHHRGCDTDVALAGNAAGDAVAIWRTHTGSGLGSGETALQAAVYRAGR